MKQRTIGDVKVSAIGLGGLPMSLEGRPDADQSIRTIHAALDAGVTLIDTADAYQSAGDEVGHNEYLISRALATWGGDTSNVLIATKGGHVRVGEEFTLDGSPAHLRRAVEGSLKRLGLEAIGLYQFHRPDPDTPYADSIGAIAELLDAGKIRMAGISNANIEQIHQAQEILGGRLMAVSNQYSPVFRSSLDELRLTEKMGIAFLPWMPLGGIGKAGELAGISAFREVAKAHDVSPQRVTLAWILAHGERVIPIPGATRPESITDNAKAPELTLTPEELARLDQAA